MTLAKDLKKGDKIIFDSINVTIEKVEVSKIAKHGKQAIIVLPSFLQEELKPKTIVEVKITILKEIEQ